MDTESASAPASSNTPTPETAVGFRFGRMFPELETRAFRPDDESLVDLGKAMQIGTEVGAHPTLTAGYSFLAQFITHDITLDLTGDIPPGPIRVGDIQQGRSPFLDLDSVYGG